MSSAGDYDSNERVSRLAGQNRRVESGMTVDYADVLRQAVDNERWRVLREIRKAVEALPETKRDDAYRYHYTTQDRTAAEFAQDVVKALDRIEEGA